MSEQVVRLSYPPALRNTPVINQLIREYDQLTINIIRANISHAESWLECQLVGSAALIENAIDWLRQRGIEVQTLGA